MSNGACRGGVMQIPAIRYHRQGFKGTTRCERTPMLTKEEQIWTTEEMKRFLENCDKFPLEELRKYAGQVIAWNKEGTRIVASAPDWDGLFQRLEELGIHPSQVCSSYLDPL